MAAALAATDRMTALSAPEQQISQFLADLLNLEAIEVGFNCFLTHRPDLDKANQVVKRFFFKLLNRHQNLFYF